MLIVIKFVFLAFISFNHGFYLINISLNLISSYFKPLFYKYFYLLTGNILVLWYKSLNSLPKGSKHLIHWHMKYHPLESLFCLNIEIYFNKLKPFSLMQFNLCRGVSRIVFIRLDFENFGGLGWERRATEIFIPLIIFCSCVTRAKKGGIKF